MSFIAAATIGGTLISGVVQSNAARRASRQQSRAADAGIAEFRRQFDLIQQLMAPFVQSGTDALSRQAALAGAAGEDAQRAAIQAIEQGSEFQALARQGEDAILQQSSATGGLRGGNIQGALAQFRPQVLSSLIEQNYNRLGGLSAMGLNAVSGQASAGMQTGTNISNLLQQQGAAQAGGTLASAQAFGNALGSVGLLAGRGMAFRGYTPPGASSPLNFGQGIFFGAGGF